MGRHGVPPPMTSLNETLFAIILFSRLGGLLLLVPFQLVVHTVGDCVLHLSLPLCLRRLPRRARDHPAACRRAHIWNVTLFAVQQACLDICSHDLRGTILPIQHSIQREYGSNELRVVSAHLDDHAKLFYNSSLGPVVCVASFCQQIESPVASIVLRLRFRVQLCGCASGRVRPYAHSNTIVARQIYGLQIAVGDSQS